MEASSHAYSKVKLLMMKDSAGMASGLEASRESVMGLGSLHMELFEKVTGRIFIRAKQVNYS